jgi:hypothetical protein
MEVGQVDRFRVIEDPWAHRSAGMKCRTCMWFVPKATQAKPGLNGQIGRCRRHAPTMNGFPAVFEADWCGDHKLDETKA